MHRWRGRVALVTGASSGIGRAIAVSLLRHGLNVVACARRVDAIPAVRQEAVIDVGDGDGGNGGVGELLAVKCDVSKEEDVLSMFEQVRASGLGGVDVCVNNAGVGKFASFVEGKTEDWRRILDTNVLGLAMCTREALKSMRERGVDDGHIIHISSIFARQVMPNLAMYCASKFAVRALTEGLRQELLAEKSGIRVTAISPGFVKTEIFRKLLGEEEAAKFLAENPHMMPKDIEAAVEYILSTPKHVQVHDVIIHPVDFPE